MYANDFDEIDDPTDVTFFVVLAREMVDLDGDGRVRLPL